MVFDVLAHDGKDTRRRTLHERRELLEELAETWAPPLQLSPATTDEVTARRSMIDFRLAGVEGLVVKRADSVYTPGRRTWIKIKSRETTEVLIGGVTGSLKRPETLVAGLVRNGELHVVGRSAPLTKTQANALAAALIPAGPEHPWPDVVSSTRFGVSGGVPLVKVEPLLVAEVLADTAPQPGGYPARPSLPTTPLRPDPGGLGLGSGGHVRWRSSSHSAGLPWPRSRVPRFHSMRTIRTRGGVRGAACVGSLSEHSDELGPSGDRHAVPIARMMPSPSQSATQWQPGGRGLDAHRPAGL